MSVSTENKATKIFEEYILKIENGSLGNSGDPFITVRELSKRESVSLVTSQKVFSLLEGYGAIQCFNKKYYITNGRISKNCKLSEVLNSRSSFLQKPLIGVLVSDLDNPFFSALTQKISCLVTGNDRIPIVMSYHNDEKLENEMLNLLMSMGVEGILSCSSSDQSIKHIYSKCILPVVLVFDKHSNNGDYHFPVDDYSAAKKVASHLLEMGYEQFMYIGTDLPTSEDVRYKGFFEQLESAGIDLADTMAFSMGTSEELPYYILQKILASKKPLGIFCYHDIIAERVLSACKKHNINVPADVGIVGFDDLPIATQIKPSLSTIAYSLDNIAKTGVEKLINLIYGTKNKSDNTVKPLNYILIIRGSSKRI